jgi:alkylhydroperoxidase family enzyme
MVAAVVEGNLDQAGLPARERLLFDYVKKVTEGAWRTTPEDVQQLRDAGWTEPQIAEAVYVTAMFAFFNRVADAFGISPQGLLEMNALPR